MDNMYFDPVSKNVEVAEKKVMLGVYGWMTLALLITALSALWVITSPAAITVLNMNFVFLIAEVVLAVYLSARAHKMSSMAAKLTFIGYSILNGITLSSIFVVYDLGSIAQAFMVTALLFAVMTVYGYVTKADLSGVGNLFMMGVVGLIIASFANMFFHNQGLDLIINYVGVIVFIGLVGYDTQKIKQLARVQDGFGGTVRNASIIGALILYLDFINLFLYLVRLFARRDD